MRLVLAGVIGLWGTALGYALFGGLDHKVLTVVAVAATFAGLVTSPLFLRDDEGTVGWSILGALTATAFGAGFVGMWIAAHSGLMASLWAFFVMPIFLFGLLVQSITALLVWIIGAFAIHALGRYSLK